MRIQGILITLIVLFSPIYSYAEEEVTTKLELSSRMTTGNSERRIFAGTLFREKDWNGDNYRYRVSGAMDYEAGVSEGYVVKGRLESKLHSTLFNFYEGLGRRNEYSGYKYQYWVGAGIGTDRRRGNYRVRFLGSLLYQEQEDISLNQYTDIVGKIELDYRYIVKPTIKFTILAERYHFLDNYEKDFWKSDTRLIWKASDRLTVGPSYVIEHQSTPPAGRVPTDKELVFLLTLTI